jgi:hypothetical protein
LNDNEVAEEKQPPRHEWKSLAPATEWPTPFDVDDITEFFWTIPE